MKLFIKAGGTQNERIFLNQHFSGNFGDRVYEAIKKRENKIECWNIFYN